MTVYRDAAANTAAAVSASISQGRSFIDTCVQLDERMGEVNSLSTQVTEVSNALTKLEQSLGIAGKPTPKG
mgnify:CR=1 FL=1|jgi:hypothetical protein